MNDPVYECKRPGQCGHVAKNNRLEQTFYDINQSYFCQCFGFSQFLPGTEALFNALKFCLGILKIIILLRFR